MLYALNTAAGVLGTLISGKLLVAIGLESALRVVPAALLAAAAVSLMLSARTKPVVASVASAALIALAMFLSTSPLVWDRELLASGIYKYARTIPAGVDLEAVLKAATLLDYRDGEHATVSVIGICRHEVACDRRQGRWLDAAATCSIRSSRRTCRC